ncbi:hypothetical protein E2C01_017937 [Portunus trituberculatus]|uniref:Uncharacterized protein n=1 Tax=Portunus trituberculatus TaxID=210409 RepID=A0A5B7DV60_PORTR|nr:hypothetical protein [Portunus trituberculatus]
MDISIALRSALPRPSGPDQPTPTSLPRPAHHQPPQPTCSHQPFPEQPAPTSQSPALPLLRLPYRVPNMPPATTQYHLPISFTIPRPVFPPDNPASLTHAPVTASTLTHTLGKVHLC